MTWKKPHSTPPRPHRSRSGSINLSILPSTPLFNGRSTEISHSRFLYLTPDRKYADNFGDLVYTYRISPNNVLNFSSLSERDISFTRLKTLLKNAGIDPAFLQSTVDSYRQDNADIVKAVPEPIWFWLVRFPEIKQEIKNAGYDAIILRESVGNTRAKFDSIVVLDPSIIQYTSEAPV